MTLHEPATTLTDYLLTLACAWFVWALARRVAPGFTRSAFIALFSSVAAASLFGGTMHGFLPDAEGTPSRVLWVATMLSVGITAAAALFLVAVFLRDWLHRRSAGTGAGILGIMLTLVAAIAQQSDAALHPLYFDHNAVYHVIQAVALYLFFRSALEFGEPN